MNTPLVRPADDSDPYGDPAVTARDLDALVAVKVMGWLATDKPQEYAPRYSTEIAAAWLVVRELERRGATIVYRSYGPRLTRNRVEITANVGGIDQLFTAEAADAPLAICLAALKAVGIPAPPPSRADD